MSIAFPHLGIFLSHVPRTIQFGSFSIAIYGITMALGILTGLFVASRMAEKTGQNPEDYTNIALLGIMLGLIGARVYYVAFSWDYYSRHPVEILNYRGGGLALYGSLIGAVAAVLIYCGRKHLKILLVLDTACIGMVTGQIIGRWGNFFNREAFGEYTDSLLAMRLPLSDVRADEVTALMHAHEIVEDGVTYIQMHPTFLYESLWNLGVLVILVALTLKGKKRFDGEIFLWYLLLYGIGRFWIEDLRTDQLLIPGTLIAVSRVLAAALAVISAGLILWIRIRFRNSEKKI